MAAGTETGLSERNPGRFSIGFPNTHNLASAIRQTQQVRLI